MKHLEPSQIAAAVDRQSPKRRSTLAWMLSTLAICIGLGAAGTAIFVAEVQDRVTDQEKQERQITFAQVKELNLPAVAPTRIEAALDGMKLPPSARSEMASLLAPTASTDQRPMLATTATGSTKQPLLDLVSMSVWDTHAEDGDVVAIVSAGYRREIVLTKVIQTVVFPVDRSAAVQIIGVRDGGGGITLGIRGSSQEILMPIMSEGQVLSLPIRR